MKRLRKVILEKKRMRICKVLIISKLVLHVWLYRAAPVLHVIRILIQGWNPILQAPPNQTEIEMLTTCGIGLWLTKSRT
jgi:hypothetical protein